MRKQSAVLVALFRDRNKDHRVVLVVRAAGGVHGGQVALPGGQAEAHDVSPLATALREAEEEIGLAPPDTEVIATLSPMNTRTTGFRVHPYVARIRAPSRWRLAPGEISAVIRPRVSELADPALRRGRWLASPTWPRPRLADSVALEGGYVVWGLTLRVLDVVIAGLRGEEWRV